jgi:hypothetical protein
MMARTPTILLFEDDDGDGQLVAGALQRRLPCTLVWFRKVPIALSPDRSDAPLLNALLGRNQSFPLDAAPGEVPQVRTANAASFTRGKSRWWQGDFDGAILDVRQDGQPLALDFLGWLQWAGFLGPVVVATLYAHPTQHFPRLPGIERLSKHEEQWQDKAVSLLMPGLNLHPQPVGARGRDPEDRGCVERYWQHVAVTAQDTPGTHRSLWVGEDQTVRNAVTAFCCHDEITRRSGWEKAREVWRGWRSKRDDPIGILGEFLGSKGRYPVVVWLDAGEGECDLQDRWELLQRFKTAVPKSFVALLAHELRGFTTEVEQHFTRMGIIAINRAVLLGEPARWAQQTADEFALDLEIVRRVDDRPPTDPYRVRCLLKLFRSYFRLLLMARSKRYVSGQNPGNKKESIPSIVPWLSSDPLAVAQVVNTSFDADAREWARELKDSALVSAQVLTLAGIRFARDDESNEFDDERDEPED